MIDEVLALPQVEIDDVDRVHLLDVIVVLATVNILRHQFGGTEQNALEVGILRLALHLDEQQLAGCVLGQDIHTVAFAVLAVLVAFALQQTVNLDVVIQQCGEKALQHSEVGLVAQQALQCPVETDVCTFLVHFPIFSYFAAKIYNFRDISKSKPFFLKETASLGYQRE